MPVVVHGWDVSPNHCGMVELQCPDFVAGETMPQVRICGWSFASEHHPSVLRYGPRAFHLPSLPKQGKHTKSVDHAVRLASIFGGWATRASQTKSKYPETYVAIEDYALGADQGAHYVGEIGGLARVALANSGVRFQLLPIKGTKKAIARNGNADKTKIAAAVVKLGLEFPDDIHETSLEDLHDAASIAYTMMMILAHRTGVVLSTHATAVMESTSKSAPTPLAQRDFLPASATREFIWSLR